MSRAISDDKATQDPLQRGDVARTGQADWLLGYLPKFWVVVRVLVIKVCLVIIY